MSPKLLCVCLVTVGARVAFSQSAYQGFNQFFNYRTWSGLPGAGYGLTADGNIDPSGAMAYSTPIAYSLGQWRVASGGGLVSSTSSFVLPNLPGFHTVSGSDGKGEVAFGVDLGQAGMLTCEYMLLSKEWDQVYNFQLTPFRQQGRLRMAVGVQDLLGHGGAGQRVVTLKNGKKDYITAYSQSPYGVGTYDLGWNGSYVSAGLGQRRFDHGFANASTNLFSNAKLFTEYDGEFVNVGVNYAVPVGSFGIGNRKYRKIFLQLNAGEAASRYAFWGIFLTL
jgi:hypothetical protein